jgi:putative oxidoreductase
MGTPDAAARKWTSGWAWALVPLRLVVGFGFAAHGLAKLTRGVDAFAPIVAALGAPAPLATAWLTTIVELVGGIGMMLGAFVVPLSVPLAITLVVALFGVHLRYGFSSVRLKSLTSVGAEFGPVGYELDLLYLAALLALVLVRTTPLSFDGWRARWRHGPRNLSRSSG